MAQFSWPWLRTLLQSLQFWLALALMAASFPIWMLILRQVPLNQAFPATALTFVGVVAGAHVLFNEPVRFVQLVGIALIVVGVAQLNGSRD